MTRKILSKVSKLSLMAVIAVVIFVGLKIATNENRLEKAKAILMSE